MYDQCIISAFISSLAFFWINEVLSDCNLLLLMYYQLSIMLKLCK